MNCRIIALFILSFLFSTALDAQKVRKNSTKYWGEKFLEKVHYRNGKLFFQKKLLVIDLIETEPNYIGNGKHRIFWIKKTFMSRTKCTVVLKVGFYITSDDELKDNLWYFDSFYEDPTCRKKGHRQVFNDERIKFLELWYKELKGRKK